MTSATPRRHPRAIVSLLAALLAATLAGCANTIPSVDNVDTGAILVTVTDQTGAGVPNAIVTIQLAEGDETEGTSSVSPTTGQVDVIQVPIGNHFVSVAPPNGYTGGGTAAGVSVTVTTGNTVTANLTLTKSGS